VLLLAVLLIAGAVWFAMPRNDPAVGGGDVAPVAKIDAPAAPVAAPLDPTRSATRDAAPPREDTISSPSEANEAREAAPTAEQAVLRVVLRGLHPKVPWTTPLRLEFVGLYDTNGAVHSDDVVPDADGRAQFVLPPWWTRCRHGRIGVKCDRYRASDHQWMGSIDPTTELVIDVQVIAELRGRVVDMRGKPVLANVVAFPGGDTPKNASVAMIASNPEGQWSLPVPPDEPVLLVAQPLRRMFEHRIVWEGQPDGAAPPPPDPAASLLPGSRVASCPAGDLTEVPDIVVPDAMLLHGLVRWDDGAPIAGAQLRLEPTGGEELALPNTSNVRRHPNGRFATTSFAATDANGAFTLPMLPGTEANVRLMSVGSMLLLANRDVVQPVRGSTIEFRMPRPVTFRVTADGASEREATFEVEAWSYPMRSESDSLAIVPNGPLRIRARKETRCSPWLDCGPAAAGKTIDLALEARLHPVTIVFEGADPGPFLSLAWRTTDGRRGAESVFREPADAPVRLFLESGRYRMQIDGRGLMEASLLFPSDAEFVVDDAPVTVPLRLRVGGTIVVHAWHGNGTQVAGTCRVLAANGEDVTDVFLPRQNADAKRGAPGEMTTGGPHRLARVLEPGEYEMVFQFPTFGERREKVTVRAGEIAEVRVRL